MDLRLKTGTAGSSLVMEARSRLQSDGWIADDFAGFDAVLCPWWVVTAVRDDQFVQADGATPEEAWLCVVERTRVFGQRREAPEPGQN